jgi:hypothetical protein
MMRLDMIRLSSSKYDDRIRFDLIRVEKI